MNKNKKKILVVMLPVIMIAVLVIFDQVTKYLAVIFLKGNDPFVMIPGGLELHYLENTGAAFGMLKDQQWFFWILTAVFLAAAFIVYRFLPKTKRFIPLTAVIMVLVSGAIGNFIDRIMHKYVIDFIYFKFINFPIFNVADIYVTLSVIFLLILLFFYYKEDDFKAIKQKNRERKQKKEDKDGNIQPDR